MNINQITSEALHLPEEERAQLAQRLLISLEKSSTQEIEKAWLTEVKQRAKELDEGIVEPISATEVRLKAQKLLK